MPSDRFFRACSVERLSSQLRRFSGSAQALSIAAFVPFPSETGGDDYGIMFILKENAAKRLMAVSNANQSRWMLAQINGRFVDGVKIDKQIDDGKLVIWKGATLADIKLFEETFKRLGQPEKK